jgi:hypothetical protein
MDQSYKLTPRGQRTMRMQVFLSYLAFFVVLNLLLFAFLQFVLKWNLDKRTTAGVVAIMFAIVATRAWNNENMRRWDRYEIRLTDEDLWLRGQVAVTHIRRSDIEQVVETGSGLRIVERNPTGGLFIPRAIERYEELRKELVR